MSSPARVSSPALARAIDTALAVGTAAVIAWGVLALGWSPFVVMALFWLENVIIGLFNVVRMLVTGARFGPMGLLGSVAVAAFFTVHYGLFTSVHGMFVVMLFGGENVERAAAGSSLFAPLGVMLGYLLAERDGWLAIAALLLLHLNSTVQWLVRTRELGPPVKELMSAPYGRIAILHMTLIASGFLVVSLNVPTAGALLLVAMKLAYDLIAIKRDYGKDEEHEAQIKARRLLVVGRSIDGRP